MSQEQDANRGQAGDLEGSQGAQTRCICWLDGKIGKHVQDPSAEDRVQQDPADRGKTKRENNPSAPAEMLRDHSDIVHKIEAHQGLATSAERGAKPTMSSLGYWRYAQQRPTA